MIDTQKNPLSTIPDDPIQVQEYTLPNGLKLLMSVNPDEPRIFTNIAVRAGSKQDPADTTGLAHYMEHMLFKGTSKIGTLNWEKESELLEQIADLYEKHRQTTDAEVRQKIYAEIDRLSSEAAKLVAPNEYDKLASAIGAASTNAYTWVEQTVYVNDIPSNELGRWMKLESERFRMMALRLFHTELETVYEEFNINQDRDFRKANNAIRQALFPQHPYGTQTTIGSAEHLRNPSHRKIQAYFKTYYVPNNMAIILAGDFDPEEAIKLAEQHFGHYVSKPIPPFKYKEQPRIEKPIKKEVIGTEAPYMELAWRLDGTRTNDPFMANLVRNILFNHQAGLLDEHLNQQQKVLEANAWVWIYEDYTVLGLYGKAREGQTLEEVEQLLLQQLQKLEKGEFEDWLIEASIKDLRLQEMQAFENNQSRTHAMTNSFILGISWQRMIQRYNWMESVSKADIMQFVKERLGEQYVVLYKHQGQDPNVIKVEKPPITAVEVQREATSEYGKAFLSTASPRLKPQFVEFDQQIQQIAIRKGVPLYHVSNIQNELFRLDFIFEMGRNSNPELALALAYLPYIGTSKYSPAALQKAFFKLGLFMNVNIYEERSYITISGLNESLVAGIQLIDHVLQSVEANDAIWQNMINDLLLKRQHQQKDRNTILRHAMSNFAKYGSESPFLNRLPEPELRRLEAQQLTNWIKSLRSFEHSVYYFGPSPIQEVAQHLQGNYHLADTLKKPTPPKVFNQLPTEKSQVFFVDFPIVQTDVLLLSKGTPHFNMEEYLLREWYNDYFGFGLSSIVFQEIRESKALAYSTYALYSNPKKKHQAHYLQAYVGTQPDKLRDAIPALLDITENMPQALRQMEHARDSILKRIESSRIARSKLFWEAQAIRDLGYNYDLQQDMYEKLSTAKAADLLAFHQQYIKGRAFKFMVLGDRKRVDLEYLKEFGPLESLSMSDIFGS